MADKNFYVSWVDKRTDPWPQWEKLQETRAGALLNGKPIQFLPADHQEWPGIPFLITSEPPTVSDSKMGQYPWPGISYPAGGEGCRLYVGPTLSALFQRGSRFHNLEALEGVYLLYQPDLEGSPHELLKKVLLGVGTARRVKDLDKRVRLVPLAGIADPTDHEAIFKRVEKWLKEEDPFDLGRRHASRQATRVTINLSPGTPAMHACWLMLRWSGALGGHRTTVEYVQGTGGVHASRSTMAESPLRVVNIDVLSRWVGHSPSPAITDGKEKEAVGLEDLKGPPFDEVRQKISHAAMLGLPILLQGERGTGKTFLAHYYHQCRQPYRQARGGASAKIPVRPKKVLEATKKVGLYRPLRVSDNHFVPVNLAEFADLNNLRDALFGWAEGGWNLAFSAYDGLLGEADAGTLFLDEIHHLDKALQAALLGPLNNRRYRPMMATYEIVSDFDLVVATNDPQWRKKLSDDFRDRIERIVLDLPSFRSFQRVGIDTLWKFWEFTLRRRCLESGTECPEEGSSWEECKQQLLGVFKRHPLPGNWRDLQRLADNVLLHLTSVRDGNTALLRWDKDKLEHAIDATLSLNG
jgi:hypothetical protein